MSEQEYYNKQYKFCDFVAGHRAEQVNNRRYNTGRKSERQQARIGEDISEISGRRVIKPVESAAELADNQTLLEMSAKKVTKLKSIDEIETGKTMFGGKVTLSKVDYGMLTDLSKKQIAAENRESELTAEIAKLKKENEEAAERNAALEQKVQEIYPLREELRKTKNELGSLKAMYKKVLDFIESLNLTQKLQEFLKQRARGVKR